MITLQDMNRIIGTPTCYPAMEGRMEKCSSCRFWSEMLAQSNGDVIEAMCLADGGPKQGIYVSERHSCSSFKANTLGAIDDPPNYGEHTRAAYLAEEGPDALKGDEPIDPTELAETSKGVTV